MYGSYAFDMSGIYKRKGEEWYLMLFRDRVGTEPSIVGQMPIERGEKKKKLLTRSSGSSLLFSLSEIVCIFSHQNDCSGNNESHHLLSTNSVLSTGLLPQIRCIVGFAQTAEMVFIIHFIGNIWLRDRRWVEKKEKKTQRKLSKNDWLYTLCQRCCDRNRDTKNE